MLVKSELFNSIDRVNVTFISIPDIPSVMFDLNRWDVTRGQVARVEALLDEANSDIFFQERVKRNVQQQDLKLSREIYWKRLVGCILTSRLRAGPGTHIDEFMQKDEFPLGLDKWPEDNKRGFASDVLAEHGIPSKRKGRYVAEDVVWFQEGGAEYLMGIGDDLRAIGEDQATKRIVREVEAALSIKPYLLGIGPKQARNYWQWLGLTQWEIPLDRRVLEWIETMPDTPSAIEVAQDDLTDEKIYRTVMSWIQALSKEVGEPPCLVDAAVFISRQE